jgi:integrase/recombinase XerC/integrase/recombinase XerD
LRRTVGTVGLIQSVPLRDVQRLFRHARPQATLASYDISGDALEWHASRRVAGFLAGWPATSGEDEAHASPPHCRN